MYAVGKSFDVPVGHRLSKHGGLCKFPHGHNMIVQVSVKSEKLNKNDMVIDFSILSRYVKMYLNEFDHAFLANEKDREEIEKACAIFGKVKYFATDPTAESISKYLYDRLVSDLEFIRQDAGNEVIIESVTVWESDRAYAEYLGG